MAVLNPVRGFEPNWSTHPGEHLEEYLEVHGLKQAEFARRAGLTPKLVSEIINGKNPVTPETALKLERVLGLKAEIWLRLQTSWDLFQARQREREAAPETKSWLSKFPIKDMKALKLLPDTRDDNVLLNSLLAILGIGEPAASAISCTWHERSMVMNHHAASSTERPTVRRPWLRRMAAF